MLFFHFYYRNTQILKDRHIYLLHLALVLYTILCLIKKKRKNDFFKRPSHIIFDAEIMETWDGLPNPDDLPSTFEVDYVRVCRSN